MEVVRFAASEQRLSIDPFPPRGGSAFEFLIRFRGRIFWTARADSNHADFARRLIRIALAEMILRSLRSRQKYGPRRIRTRARLTPFVLQGSTALVSRKYRSLSLADL